MQIYKRPSAGYVWRGWAWINDTEWVGGMKHVNVNGGLKEKINGIESVTGS